MEPQNYAPIALNKERENNRERLQSRAKNNDELISPNEESAGSEQEDKRAFLQGEGRFQRQGISELLKTGHRQRSRSSRSSSQDSDRNWKSRHHHRHHHHRHHHKRDAKQSERNMVVTGKDQDSSSD